MRELQQSREGPLDIDHQTQTLQRSGSAVVQLVSDACKLSPGLLRRTVARAWQPARIPGAAAAYGPARTMRAFRPPPAMLPGTPSAARYESPRQRCAGARRQTVVAPRKPALGRAGTSRSKATHQAEPAKRPLSRKRGLQFGDESFAIIPPMIHCRLPGSGLCTRCSPVRKPRLACSNP